MGTHTHGDNNDLLNVLSFLAEGKWDRKADLETWNYV
jgi:hypothetical protein